MSSTFTLLSTKDDLPENWKVSLLGGDSIGRTELHRKETWVR